MEGKYFIIIKCKTMINHVRETRKKLGLSEDQLAHVVQCNPETIRSIENGKYIPNGILMFRIAKYFKMRADELFELQGAELKFNEVPEEKVRTSMFPPFKFPWFKTSSN